MKHAAVDPAPDATITDPAAPTGSRVIFLDIDGTLADWGVVPPAHSELIRAARRNGHTVLLCTGRAESRIPADASREVDGIVSSAGARVRLDGTLLEDVRYPSELAARAVEVLRRHDVAFVLEAPDSVRASDSAEPLDGFAFAKITVQDSAVPIEDLAAEIGPGVRALPNSVDAGAPRSGELQLADVDKADGIRTVLARLGRTPAEVVGAGDGMNDLGMLELAGTAIAIEGSPAPVLALADLVTPGPHRAGLVDAFRRLGLV